MKVIRVKPETPPELLEIEGGLENLQEMVGGYIEAVYPFDDPVAIVCNEEGKLIGLPLNRALMDEAGNVYDILAGDFLVVGLGEESFCSLSEEMSEKYMERFSVPERFARTDGGKICVIRG